MCINLIQKHKHVVLRKGLIKLILIKKSSPMKDCFMDIKITSISKCYHIITEFFSCLISFFLHLNIRYHLAVELTHQYKGVANGSP